MVPRPLTCAMCASEELVDRPHDGRSEPDHAYPWLVRCLEARRARPARVCVFAVLLAPGCAGEPEQGQAPADVPAAEGAPGCPDTFLDVEALGFVAAPRGESEWTRPGVSLVTGGTLADHPELARVELLGLSSVCPRDADADVRARLQNHRDVMRRYAEHPFGPHEPELARVWPVVVTTLVDEERDGSGVLVYRVEHPSGAPPGWVRDEYRALCVRRVQTVVASLRISGPLDRETAGVAELRALCERIEVRDQRPP